MTIASLCRHILLPEFITFFTMQSSSHLGRMASTHRARKRIREAKRKARPELATREMWVQNDYANTFDLSWERVILFGLVSHVKHLPS